ncbi:hypothetical protein PFUGPA_04549 [Plasmodium falciparum Palo Alto/Uganda]|uniref:Uncharacterized protein n=1 Tax=Plasmodium falciparum (isolate Palo Alto / Uganda) TaxID=57270 RepID=W4IUS0_PLAFP|nr:hypothetical protein PFUGPA_04549 [Plasmodium falciparum Palo Alto/Uganda]
MYFFIYYIIPVCNIINRILCIKSYIDLLLCYCNYKNLEMSKKPTNIYLRTIILLIRNIHYLSIEYRI